jgi:hypothetical protein
MIKGQPNEEAVQCTSNKTYAVRSVVLSNSVLVVTRPPDPADGTAVVEGDTLVIRDQVKEILELVPSVPRLHKLGTLLRGLEYDEGQEDVDMDEDRPVSTSMYVSRRVLPHGIGKTKCRWFTYEDAQREIQASEAELANALKDKRILILNGTPSRLPLHIPSNLPFPPHRHPPPHLPHVPMHDPRAPPHDPRIPQPPTHSSSARRADRRARGRT